MKRICQCACDNAEQSQWRVVPEGGETVLTSNFMSQQDSPFGTLVIDEGIQQIEEFAFVDKYYHTYHFPSTLTYIGECLFERYSYNTIYPIKIVYNGTSQRFIEIATERTESRYETDGFDRYPYYSGGSRWVTYYHSFDERVANIEVECAQDGVTLLYGTMRNRPQGVQPKVKQKN